MSSPRQPGPGEHTHWSWALVGFYVSCAVVALGATVAAAAYMWFESVGGLVVGCLMTGVSSVTCLLCLRRARLE